MSNKITCQICKGECHSIAIHLKNEHKDLEMTVDEYQEKFPGEPIFSNDALKALEQSRQKKKLETEEAMKEVSTSSTPAPSKLETFADGEPNSLTKRPLHELFNIEKKIGIGLNSKGNSIPVSCVNNSPDADLIPEANETYVYDPDLLKNVLLALELKINTYIWGHKGTGKSELFEQIAARTGRPFMRIQHSANTEESHIVGMWTVKGGETVFELGPLALAMKNGWLYLADEYDFAQPSVLSVYQAVLEGKPLMIKEADAENRIIKPHPNFRFVATGNTNGSGDDTGLYQGTNLQNSANYDRFGMVIKKEYMPKQSEILILEKRCGLITADAEKLVQFATLIRDAYDGAKIGDVISPRSLIDAATIGKYRGDFRVGVQMSFINKLNRSDAEVVSGLAQRVFGS